MPQPLHHLFEVTPSAAVAPVLRTPQAAVPSGVSFERNLRQREFRPLDPGTDSGARPVGKRIQEYLAKPFPALHPTTHFVSQYARSGKSRGPRSTAPAISPQIAAAIRDASRLHRVPEQLIHAVVRAESAYNPHAVSRAGARGLMQLMPGTASDLQVRNSFDVRENIDGGTRYLRQMLDANRQNIPLAVAAYNAGPEAVRRFGGIPPYRETRNYVDRVMSYFHSPAKTV